MSLCRAKAWATLCITPDRLRLVTNVFLQGMEVGEATVDLVGNARRLEVVLEHDLRLLESRPIAGPEGGRLGFPLQPSS